MCVCVCVCVCVSVSVCVAVISLVSVAQREGVIPSKLAYDRPSGKFLAFLGKYYGLWDYTPQTNNFVVFHQYFAPAPPGTLLCVRVCVCACVCV